jgi:asparagine synthase (glutamine-hydrolysing)
VLTAWPSFRSTCYAAIERLPLGCALTVTATDVRSSRYFDLAACVSAAPPPPAERPEALREVLARAVADRLPDGRAVIALSGGLDSGAVAVTAGRLAAGGAATQLAAVTHVPLFASTLSDTRTADERPLVVATARAAGIDDLTWLDSAHHTPIAGMRRALQITGAPAHAPSNQFWMLDALGAVRDRGSSVLLTGQRGNATVSWSAAPGPRQWRLHLRRRDWRAAVEAFLPTPWRTRVQAARRARRSVAPWREYSAIHPRFAAQLRLVERMADAGHDPTFSGSDPEVDERVHVLRTARGALAEAGLAFGVDVRDPTADLRVVRFCLSLPTSEFLGPNGEGRWLIRRAMADLLPPEVLWNRRRGMQSADLPHRLRAEAAAVEAILAASDAHPVARAWLDVPWLREVWRRIHSADDLAAHRQAVSVLARGLMIGIFLTEDP